MPDFAIDWVSQWTSVGWVVHDGDRRREVLIPRHAYLRAPAHLGCWRALARFRKMAGPGQFRDWWLQACGGDHRVLKRFLLQFPSGVWDVPWEFLVGEIDEDRRLNISVVRGLPDGPSVLPSQFDRPMSTVLVKGDDGSRSGLNKLDLDREISLLLETYDRLPVSQQAAMTKPRVLQPTQSELRTLFQHEHTVPDVIFLSGHGSNNPPAFILADGTSLTPELFAEIISATRVRPMFVVFWACDTARDDDDVRTSPAPPFFGALLRSGISSLLAMQAPVTDHGAILLAQELFQSLAGGDALDVAAARARATLLDALKVGVEGISSVDWACPVVWSSGLSAARLGWRSPTSNLAQMQSTSRRARIDRDGRVLFPPNAAEIGHARRLMDSRLSWITAENLADHRERWIRLLLAAQNVVPRYTVAVELHDNTSAEDALRDWAEELQQTLQPSEASAEFRMTLELIRRHPVEGWAKLCSLPDSVISVWNPPSYCAGDWFWQPLDGGTGPVIVAARAVQNAVLAAGWSIETLDMQYDLATLEHARAQAPLLSDALALLDVPVPRTSIEAIGPAVRLMPQIEAIVVQTAANEIVLAAPAARYFRGQMNEDAKRIGHLACMKILAHKSFTGRLTPMLREQRLTHCLAAGAGDAAIAEASVLLLRYRDYDRPRSAISLMHRLGAMWRDLSPHLLIIFAWANAMIGEMDQADFWLRHSSANDVFDEAWKHGLRAEIDKASGDRDGALQDIDQAIGVLIAAPESERTSRLQQRLRSYRQDRARILQYLYYNTAVAASEYQTLLDDWHDAEDASIDIAIVLRNYAECVRTGHLPGEPEWLHSKEMLDQATAHLADNTDHPVFAEIEYEKARVAIAEKASNAHALLKDARNASAKSGHLMLLAIVNARLFWQFDTFDLTRWKTLDADLTAFPSHGWAVRTLIDGRLRAAKRIADRAAAIEFIESGAQTMRDHPALTAGSDRFRIAALAAGHDLLTAGTGAIPRWPDFLSLPCAAKWLRDEGLQTAEDVWGRVS
jgi:hypothetical protein